MEIITLRVGQLQANCYLLFDRQSLHCLIIDPGDDADYIERIISDKGLVPDGIFATHGHFDHIMAVTELKLAYGITFALDCRDRFLVNNMNSSARHFTGIEAGPPPQIDECLKESRALKLGNSRLKVIHTPGHTPGSVCLYNPEKSWLITGDTIFADSGVGRTDFSYSSHTDLQDSLSKIFKLPPETVIYPGHGRPSTLKEEQKR